MPKDKFDEQDDDAEELRSTAEDKGKINGQRYEDPKKSDDIEGDRD